MSLDRLAYKIECVSALAGTGCQYGLDMFAPDAQNTCERLYFYWKEN